MLREQSVGRRLSIIPELGSKTASDKSQRDATRLTLLVCLNQPLLPSSSSNRRKRTRERMAESLSSTTPLRPSHAAPPETPITDFTALESQKENIQPLSTGRSAHALSTLFASKPKVVERELKEVREAFERELAEVESRRTRELEGADVGEEGEADPLDVYERSVLPDCLSSSTTPEMEVLTLARVRFPKVHQTRPRNSPVRLYTIVPPHPSTRTSNQGPPLRRRIRPGHPLHSTLDPVLETR